MSIALYVYAARGREVSRGDLMQRLAADGWQAVCVADGETPSITGDGRLGDDAVFSGAPSHLDRESLMALISAGNREALEHRAEQGELARCTISVQTPYDFSADYTESEAAELAASPGIGEEPIAFLRQARTAYGIHTSMGRTPVDFDLQCRIWQAIGEITGGLMEDPQAGEYRFAADTQASAPRRIAAPPLKSFLRMTAPSALLFLVALGLALFGLLGDAPGLVRAFCSITGFVLLRQSGLAFVSAWSRWAAGGNLPSSPGDLPDKLRAYAQEAERSGIPVRWEGQTWSIPTEELSLPQMEKLLSLTPDVGAGWAGDEIRARMCRDVLLEYKSRKGKTFFDENRAWFEAMEAKHATPR